jgi:hypothetical protein
MEKIIVQQFLLHRRDDSMAGNVDAYTFNFKKEVKGFQHELGPLADNIVFVYVDIANNPPRIVLPHVIAGKGIGKGVIDQARKIALQVFSQQPEGSSFAIPFQKHEGGIVFINHNNDFFKAFGGKSRRLAHLRSIYHETAHVLIKNPREEEGHAFGEATADAYLALRFFQRFGRDAEQHLSMWSWARAMGGLSGDTEHLTTTVIDRVIADSRREDFSKLSIEETIRRAERYAQEWTPGTAQISEALAFIAKKGSLEGVLRGAEASSNKLAFYLAAKIVQPMLQQEGMMLGGKFTKWPEATRQQAANDLAARTEKLTLSDIFNRTAMKDEPSIAETLKIALPRGQKRFVFKG